MPLTSLTRVCSIGLMLLPLAVGLAADSAAGKTAAKVLLEKGWKKPAGKDALVDHSRLEEPPLAGDSSVLAAKWLVLMYQSRWDDALVGLEKFLKTEPAEDLKIQALRAKAWILTVKKDYPKAMVVADQLSQAAAPNPQVTDKATLEAQNEAIAFVGRLVGFVEGPGDEAGDQLVRAKLETRVLERLDEARKEKFKAAKTEVLEEFERLMNKAKEAKEDTKEDAAAEKQKKLEDLSKADAELSKKANEVEDKGKKLAEELKKRIAELDRMEMPLAQEMLLLEGQVATLNTRLSQQQSLVREYSRPKDSKSSSFNDSSKLREAQNAVASLQGQITIRKSRYTMIQAQRQVIQQQRLQAGGGAMMQGQQLANQQQEIERAKLKNEYKQKRTEKMKAGVGGKALSLETEARAFRTYDTFQLEELRENLLSKVK